MAIYSGFFGGDPAPEYTQPQFAAVLAKLFTNGVTANFEDEFAVSENDPVSLSVIVPSGWAWIEGFWIHNTTDVVKSLAAADPDNDRIDRIILRLDNTTELEISIEVLEGTPAGSPTAPALTQTASTYEISLAQVLVEEDVTSVSDAKITDERTYVTAAESEKTILTTITSSATPTPAIASKRTLYIVTALAEAATFGAPTGTPKLGDALLIWVKSSAAAERTLNWNTIYKDGSTIRPTKTLASTTKYVKILYIFDGTDWRCDFKGSDI